MKDLCLNSKVCMFLIQGRRKSFHVDKIVNESTEVGMLWEKEVALHY